MSVALPILLSLLILALPGPGIAAPLPESDTHIEGPTTFSVHLSGVIDRRTDVPLEPIDVTLIATQAIARYSAKTGPNCCPDPGLQILGVDATGDDWFASGTVGFLGHIDLSSFRLETPAFTLALCFSGDPHFGGGQCLDTLPQTFLKEDGEFGGTQARMTVRFANGHLGTYLPTNFDDLLFHGTAAHLQGFSINVTADPPAPDPPTVRVPEPETEAAFLVGLAMAAAGAAFVMTRRSTRDGRVC